ncbi:hypothetical protein A9Q99_07025 [Gammaproteobacteria bacterium 45_16_T64]|nr:hypothetical protein A9Q99_07025 [Gammaproteobacteria bacterium 45_16_T64]
MKLTKSALSKLLVMGLAGGIISCGGEPTIPDVLVDTDGDGIYDHQETNGYYYLDGEFYTLERIMADSEWSDFGQIEEDGVEPPQNRRTPFKLAYDTMNNNDFVTSLGGGEVAINFDGLVGQLSAAFEKEYGDTHRFYKSGSNVAGSYKNILLRLNQNYRVLEPTAFGGDALPYYFTNPDLSSSDRDPYSDYDEVVGGFIVGNVTKVHPSVAAFPVIEATLESYSYTPRKTIEDSQGKEISSTVSHSVETSTSQTDSWEASVSVTGTVSFVPSVEVTVSAGVGGSYTSGEVVSDSNENSEGFSWESATTIDTSCAADLVFVVDVQNSGTAPAQDIDFVFQVRIGDSYLAAFEPEFTVDLNANGVPVPSSSALAYEVECLTLGQLQHLQLGGAIALETRVNAAKIPYLGDDDELIEFGSDWMTYISMAMLQDSKIQYSIFNQSGELERSVHYVDPVNRHKTATLRDMIGATLDIECDAQGRASFCFNDDGEIVQSPETYVGIVRTDDSDDRLDELLGNSTDILDVKLEPMWEYHIITTTSDVPAIRSVNINVDDADVQIVARVTDELGVKVVQFCESETQCSDMEYNAAAQLFTFTPEQGRVPTGNEFLKAVNSRDNSVTSVLDLPRTWHSQITVRGRANTNYGSWGGWAMCPPNTYAQGFSLKVEGSSFDDTAMNRIALICSDKSGAGSTRIIASGDGGWGRWGNTVNCSAGQHLYSFNLKTEAYQGLFGDDSAANAVRFKCGNGSEIVANNEGPAGGWGGYQNANNDRYRVCGVRSQIEGDQGDGADDTALNNVEFRYCDYSGVFN